MTIEAEIKKYRVLLEGNDSLNIISLAECFIGEIKSESLFTDNPSRVTTLLSEIIVESGSDLLVNEIVNLFTFDNLEDESLLKLILSISRLETEEFRIYRKMKEVKVSSTALSLYFLNKILLSNSNISPKTIEIVYTAMVPDISKELYRFLVEQYFDIYQDMASLNHVNYIVNTVANIGYDFDISLLNMRELTKNIISNDIKRYKETKFIKISDFIIVSFPSTPIFLLEMEVIKFANNYELNEDNLNMFNNYLYELNEVSKKKFFN